MTGPLFQDSEPPTPETPLRPSESTLLRPSGAPGEVPSVAPGTTFGRYRLLAELGRGGMGVVWRAADPALNRDVALKLVRPDGAHDGPRVERFLREAQLAARLRHPAIVAVHDVGVHEGLYYFTTELIAGVPLDRRLKTPVPPRTAIAWTVALAEALAYAHAQGVVHRDVKPSNILLDKKDAPLLTDFGLAKSLAGGAAAGATSPTLTEDGALLGTPQYMSPEQASGDTERIGPASDQFSLGAVGRFPHIRLAGLGGHAYRATGIASSARRCDREHEQDARRAAADQEHLQGERLD